MQLRPDLPASSANQRQAQVGPTCRLNARESSSQKFHGVFRPRQQQLMFLTCACAAAALPLNPDDNPADVKQEEQAEDQGSQRSSQQGAGTGSQQDSGAQVGQKRLTPGVSPAARSPAAKRAKHEAQPPAKGQKTMQTFFAAK
jgi:hypothetical protein